MRMADSEKPVKIGPSRFELYCEKLDINPNLVMLKLTLFVMYGATASLLPFLTIHMQSIGLTVEEIAIVYLALPLTTFLSPPITGFLVDRFGHYKAVVIISLVLNGVFHQSLTLIPQTEIPGETPMAYVLRHPETGKVEVWWSPCPSRECPEDEELNLVLDQCDDHCLLRNSSSKPPGLLKGIHQSIAVRPPTRIFNQPNNVGCHGGYQGRPPSETPNWGILPEDLHFHLEKKKTSNHSTTGIRSRKKTSSSRNRDSSVNHSLFFVVDMHPDLMDPNEYFGIELEPDGNDTVTDFRQHFSRELLESAGVNFTALEEEDLRCGGFVVATNLTIRTLKELAADCMLQKCIFRDGGPEVCPPNYKESDDHVFWIYFGLRFLGTTMLSASVTVMDPIALTMVQKYGGEFGRERLFSTLGMAIFSPLSGLLIDYSSRKLGYTDYSAAFYVYSGLLAVSCFTVLLMPIGAKMPADHLVRDMLKLISMPHVIVFVFFLFALGNCWGFIESYLFLYLKELGAPNYLLGVTVTVGTLSSIPFLYGAEKICRKVGHVNIIVIAFFSHAARLMGYSYIDNAWWCFPFEAMESLSVHLMWVAAATYCAIIAPKTLLATVIGVLGMAHFSLGRGSGSFGGGLLISTVGIRQAFRIMGTMSIGSGVLYGVMHFFWLHKYSTQDEADNSGEVEKINDDIEKDDKEKLSESIERLSLMIRFNHRGSLASLTDHHRSSSRRNSSNTSLLKSALETHHKFSNPQINLRTSAPQLARSTFKISNGQMNSEQSSLIVGTPQQVRRNSKGITLGTSATHITMPVDEFRNRSDSIREEDESDGLQSGDAAAGEEPRSTGDSK